MLLDADDLETVCLIRRYAELLALPTDRLKVTTRRDVFAAWLGRRVAASIGGAYAYLARTREHAVLINLDRIDRTRPRSLEVVVAEELLHMRDRLDGDLRRHAKHGYDRIARRVALLTGASLDEIRQAIVSPRRRHLRYVYQCLTCGIRVPRRIKGTWSCGRCSPRYDRRHLLQLVEDRGPVSRGGTANSLPGCQPSSGANSELDDPSPS